MLCRVLCRVLGCCAGRLGSESWINVKKPAKSGHASGPNCTMEFEWQKQKQQNPTIRRPANPLALSRQEGTAVVVWVTQSLVVVLMTEGSLLEGRQQGKTNRELWKYPNEFSSKVWAELGVSALEPKAVGHRKQLERRSHSCNFLPLLFFCPSPLPFRGSTS